MDNITKASFEATIKALLGAKSRNASKGKVMKDWFEKSFSIKATVSNVKEDKQIGNRIAEQYKHKAPIVVFVCNEGVTEGNLIKRAIAQRYPTLNTLLIVTVTEEGGYTYDKIYCRSQDSFTEWAAANLNVTIEPLVSSNFDNDDPLQQIFYGAPGTGKSKTIKDKTKEQAVVRTTFHPDSDYSTFVGAYKPTMGMGKVYGAQGPLKKNGGEDILEPQIGYEFVIQAFLKAYLMAWKKMSENKNDPKPQFLIIEEINRGNCAQIFGDLFQLLDRGDNKYSAYPIEADTDLQQAIEKAFKDNKLYKLSADLDVDDALDDYTSNYDATLSEDIQSGRVLLLPKNLYIWATMNTSDQSLFPIDSAFKRRWDWKYIPIANGEKGWNIEANGYLYNWWEFLYAINDVVEQATSSEDKKLGYFFTKANDKNVISADKFVSKVVFYLWNDVFKDFGFDWKNKEGKPIFRDADSKLMTFRSFFKPNGNVVEEQVKQLLDNLQLKGISTAYDIEEDNKAGNKHKSLKSISFNDGTTFSTEDMTHFDAYVGALKKIGLDVACPVVEEMKYRRREHPLVSREKYPEVESGGYSYQQEGEYFIVKGAIDDTLINVLSELNTRLNLGMTINFD